MLPSNPPPPACRRGFTLTELLVVIALIVLLVGLLLAALGQVQQKAKQTTTSATMQAFANACETFRQEHGFYPGFVPEDVLVEHVRANQGPDDMIISGTENALLHLMGGFRRYADYDGELSDYYAEYPQNEWVPFNFGSGPYRTSVNPAAIGEGPVIGVKPYAPYFTPSDKEFGLVDGQFGDPEVEGSVPKLPDLLDAWGQPIIYLRAQRSVGPITSADTDDLPQFSPESLEAYCKSEKLGKTGRNQVYEPGDGKNPGGSILSGDTLDVVGNLRRLLEHPALPGQTRGRFMLLSAGKDGVYFSAQDGPGSSETDQEIYDVYRQIENGDLPPDIFSEYDDVLIFGGSS